MHLLMFLSPPGGGGNPDQGLTPQSLRTFWTAEFTRPLPSCAAGANVWRASRSQIDLLAPCQLVWQEGKFEPRWLANSFTYHWIKSLLTILTLKASNTIAQGQRSGLPVGRQAQPRSATLGIGSKTG